MEETTDQGDIETAIGYRFDDSALLTRALTHKSYSEEAKARGQELKDNQRLEFLGDAVLSLIVSERLIASFPHKREGDLTKWRASFVDGKSLAKKAVSIDLGARLLLGKGEEQTGGRGKQRVLEDAFEALIGAVYLDGGLGPARLVTNALFSDEFKGVEAGTLKRPENYKGLLQELLQRHGGSVPRYEVVETSGMDHQKHFVVEASWKGRTIGRGEGPKKSQAEQVAAKDALDHIGERLPEINTP